MNASKAVLLFLSKNSQLSKPAHCVSTCISRADMVGRIPAVEWDMELPEMLTLMHYSYARDLSPRS